MNISFRANVIVDKDLTKKLNPNDAAHINEVVGKCQKFMELPVVKQLTDGDTLEINNKRERGERGYTLRMIFNSKNNKEPYDMPICGKCEQISFYDCLFQICLYLYYEKFGCHLKYSCSSRNMVAAVLDKLKEMNNTIVQTTEKN